MVGLFASKAVNPLGADALFHGGGARSLIERLVAVAVVTVYTGAAKSDPSRPWVRSSCCESPKRTNTTASITRNTPRAPAPSPSSGR